MGPGGGVVDARAYIGTICGLYRGLYGFYRDCMGLYRDYMGLYRDCMGVIGIMEKRMETVPGLNIRTLK